MSSAANFLDEVGGRMLEWAPAMNLWAAAVLVVVVALDLLLVRRIGAGWRIALYAVVLLRLALPVDWASPVGIVRDTGPDRAVPPIHLVEQGAQSSEAPPVWNAAAPGESGLSEVAPGIAQMGEAASPAGWSWRSFVPLFWGAGTVVLFAIVVSRHLALARIVRESREVDAEAIGVGVVTATPMLVHPVAAPMLAGVLHPRIVIPERLLAADQKHALSFVLRHESAHVSRRDHLLAAALSVLLALLWPIAPLWIAASRMRALMEQAADERALSASGGESRAAYARVLLDMLDRGRAPGAAATGALGFGQSVRSRLGALRFQRRWGTLVQGAVVVALSAALLAGAGIRQPTGEAPKAHQEVLPPPVETREGAVVRVVLLATWPKHPALDFGVMRQEMKREGEAQPADAPARIRTVSIDEAEAIIKESRAQPWRQTVLAEGRLALPTGGASTIRMPRGSTRTVHTDGYSFNVSLLEAGEEEVRLRINFREMSSGESTHWHDTGDVKIPARSAGYALVTGFKGPSRLLFIEPEYRSDLPLMAGFNPMDASHYPVVATQIAVHRLTGETPFEKLLPDAEARPLDANPAAIHWARSMQVDQRDAYFRAIEGPARGAHLLSPSLMIRPGQTTATRPDSVDKEGLSTGDHRITAHATLDGGEVRLTLSHEMRNENGEFVRRAILADAPAPEGQLVTFMHGPIDGHWYVLSAQTRIINSKDAYPFGRSSGLAPAPAPEDR